MGKGLGGCATATVVPEAGCGSGGGGGGGYGVFVSSGSGGGAGAAVVVAMVVVQWKIMQTSGKGSSTTHFQGPHCSHGVKRTLQVYNRVWHTRMVPLRVYGAVFGCHQHRRITNRVKKCRDFTRQTPATSNDEPGNAIV